MFKELIKAARLGVSEHTCGTVADKAWEATIEQQAAKVEAMDQLLQKLAEAEGPCSVNSGVLWLETGEHFNLQELIAGDPPLPGEQSLVITGNPVDGLVYWGPFMSHDAAVEYADRGYRHADWWVTTLNPPGTE